MISGIGRRFGRPNGEQEAAPPPAAVEPPVVAFAAFAADCRITACVSLTTERLSDMLNGVGELALRGVVVESLEDGAVHEVGELVVDRDELYAVVAGGPGGQPARRLRTQTMHVEVDLGPYHVEGDLHGTPASNPLRSVLRRAAWVPLTHATIGYRSNGSPASDTFPTLLLNRAMATSFRAHDTPYVGPPWERPAVPPGTAAADAPGDAGPDAQEGSPG